MTVQDMDITYPSQHTMSGNHRPASEMPFKCFRCCIAKKEEKKVGEGGGGGVGDQFESPVEFHSIFFLVFFFFFFFCCMCCFFYGLWRGGTLLKLFVSLNRILKGGATGGCFSGLGELHVSMDLIRVFQ